MNDKVDNGASDTDDYDGNNKEYDHDHKYVDDMMMMLMINFDENVDCRSLHRKTCARLHSIQPFVRRVCLEEGSSL